MGPATYNALVSAPQLKDFLQTYPAILRWAISQAWRLDWPEADYQPQAEELAAAMLTSGRLAEVVASLPTPAAQALRRLLDARGALPAPTFERRFGEARLLGEARLARERPWEGPDLAPAETLWYRGLVGRRTSPEAVHYLLPADLRPLLEPLLPAAPRPLRSRPALTVSPALEVVLAPGSSPHHRARLEAAAVRGRSGRYQITSASLRAYLRRGGSLAALLRYLRSASGRPLPPPTVERLKKLAGKAPSKAKG